MAVELVQNCPRDFRVEKIRQHPHFYAFYLARLNHPFHLAEQGVFGRQDHSVRRMFMQQSQKLFHRDFVHVQLGDNLQVRLRLFNHLVVELLRVFQCADEDKPPPELHPADLCLRIAPHRFLLGHHQQKTDPSKQNNHRARKLNPKQKHHQNQSDRYQRAGFEQLPGRFPPGRQQRPIIESQKT